MPEIYLQSKSTLEEIRERFDNDVERFSNLETGQSATVDAPLAMELVTQRRFPRPPWFNVCWTSDVVLEITRSSCVRC